MSYQFKQPCLPPPCLKGSTVCVGAGTTVCISPTQGRSIEVCTSPTGVVCVSQGQTPGHCANVYHDCCGSVVVSPVQSQSSSPCDTAVYVTKNQGQSSTICVPQQQGCQCTVCQDALSMAPIQNQSSACTTICTSPGSSVCISPILTPMGLTMAVCQDPYSNNCVASKGAIKGATKCSNKCDMKCMAPGTVVCMDPCKDVKSVKSCDDPVNVKECASISMNHCNVKKC